MSFIKDLFKNKNKPESKSASIVKERLQIIIANDIDSQRVTPEILNEIELGILKLFKKHMKITRKAIDIKVVKSKGKHVVELNILLPD